MEKISRRTALKYTAGSALTANSLIGSKAYESESSDRQSESSVNWSRRIPLRYEADIAVIGGGIAVVSAAAAAARIS